MNADFYFNLNNGAHRGKGRDSQRHKWEISRKFYCLPLGSEEPLLTCFLRFR